MNPDAIQGSPSATPDNRLTFVKEIGRGSEGVVYSAVPSSGGTEVAVKVVTGPSLERCRATSHLWPLLAHPNVVAPRWSHFDDATGHCFMEMELLSEDLFDYVFEVGPLRDERISEIAGHLAAALQHIHQQGVAHNDIKTENVFLRNGVAALGDLGSIIHVQRSAGETAAGTPGFVVTIPYAPPEYFARSGRATTQERDFFAGDMWSLGVTLYTAVARVHPWDEPLRRCPLFKRVLKEGIEATLPDSFSPGFKKLLTRLLQVDPTKRPTAGQVLADPWVTAPHVSPSSFSPTPDEVSVAVGSEKMTKAEAAAEVVSSKSRKRKEPVETSMSPVAKRSDRHSIATLTHPSPAVTAAAKSVDPPPEANSDRSPVTKRRRSHSHTEAELSAAEGPCDRSPVTKRRRSRSHTEAELSATEGPCVSESGLR